MRTHRFMVPNNYRWDNEAKKIFSESAPYFFKKPIVALDADSVTISIDDPSDIAEAEKLLHSTLRDLTRSLRDLKEQVLLNFSGSRSLAYDVYELLSASNSVIESSPGIYSYRGHFVSAMALVDSFIKRYSQSVAAREEVYPSTVPLASLHRSGYIESFPHHALFVSPIKLENDCLNNVKELVKEQDFDVRDLRAPREVMAPTVCHHFFTARRDATSTDVGAFTAVNSCHRHELIPSGLQRLMNFRMREIIFVGTPEYIQSSLDNTLNWFLRWLESWEISFSVVTATDPFFASTKASERYYQSIAATKKEVRLYVAETDNWISVASFNFHGPKLLENFNIILEQQDSPSSGCVGFGLERLTYSLMSSLGLDIKEWPEAPEV